MRGNFERILSSYFEVYALAPLVFPCFPNLRPNREHLAWQFPHTLFVFVFTWPSIHGKI